MSLLYGYCSIDGCERPRLSGLDVCYSHNKLRNDEKKIEVKKQPKPINKVSEKKRKDLILYTPLRRDYLKKHPYCQFRFADCTGKATDIHHCSTSNVDFLNVVTWMGGCRNCHQKCENMPASLRRELGYLIDSPNQENPTI